MNFFKRFRSGLVLATALICFGSVFASPVKAKRNASAPKQISVNIQAVCDSALLMADDYALALESRPEMVSVRMNALKNYYNAIPSTEAQDSVRQRIFDFYVNYVEKAKAEPAKAFRDCFTAIAPENDENRGAILALDLSQARIDFDTTAVRALITQLESFAARNNLDYDADLAEARAWLHEIETRKPIKDILPGVWVSEDMAGGYSPGIPYDNFPEKECLINSIKILRIRNTGSEVYQGRKVKTNDSINNLKLANGDLSEGVLDAMRSHNMMDEGVTTVYGWQNGYFPIEDWERPAFNMTSIENPTGSESPKYSCDDDQLSRQFVTDNKSYSAYIYWGDERLKRPNAEVGAIIRQTAQNSQAVVAGHLSRSKYSTADRLLGNVANSIVDAGVNAIVDALMVSKDKIWNLETVIQIENPYKLRATTYAQLIISKSNASEPEVYNYNHENVYYRWEPEDSLVFVGTHSDRYSPDYIFGGRLKLINVKDEAYHNRNKKIKDYCKEFKGWLKNEEKKRKSEIKSMKDGPEKDEKKKALKQFQKYPPQAWMLVNYYSLQKLKAKADNYKPE